MMDPKDRWDCTKLLSHSYMDQSKDIYDSRKEKPDRKKNAPSRISNHYVSIKDLAMANNCNEW